jgi:UDP-N-acetylglucosamine diphosphorylase/glucosamine-1-phosphate N-acetyltransferase
VILLYEDECWSDLHPLVTFRPVFDLLCGSRTLLDNCRGLYPREQIGLLVRPEMARLTREQHPELLVNPDLSRIPESSLFLSARAILKRAIPVRGRPEILTCGDELVGFRTRTRRLHRLPVSTRAILISGLPRTRVQALVLRHPWDIIEHNESRLVHELRPMRSGRRLPAGAQLIGPTAGLIWHRTATIDPGAVLDTRLGRILLAERCAVRPGSIIAGPCYVGPATMIDAARIRPGCSFGPDCRIGGEVEASVFLGHANKHHEGFIGHALVGEWVNLGALTTNSDLRNDYGEVKTVRRGRIVNTGMRKFGCMIGDHAKTAIGTLLNTGACIGVFANWFEPGISPMTIPDFAWGSRRRWELDDALTTARTVMSRRGCHMTSAYEQLVRDCHAQNKKKR